MAIEIKDLNSLIAYHQEFLDIATYQWTIALKESAEHEIGTEEEKYALEKSERAACNATKHRAAIQLINQLIEDNRILQSKILSTNYQP